MGAKMSGGPMAAISKSTPTRISKGSARRESIISEAEAMFAEAGYNQPTMIDVAARCGISRGGLLRYFATKELLLVAVLERRGMVSNHGDNRKYAVDSTLEQPDLEGVWEVRGRRFDALL